MGFSPSEQTTKGKNNENKKEIHNNSFNNNNFNIYIFDNSSGNA
jgi:hypothetical protein